MWEFVFVILILFGGLAIKNWSDNEVKIEFERTEQIHLQWKIDSVNQVRCND